MFISTQGHADRLHRQLPDQLLRRFRHLQHLGLHGPRPRGRRHVGRQQRVGPGVRGVPAGGAHHVVPAALVRPLLPHATDARAGQHVRRRREHRLVDSRRVPQAQPVQAGRARGRLRRLLFARVAPYVSGESWCH